jgi:hypothetical protein
VLPISGSQYINLHLHGTGKRHRTTSRRRGRHLQCALGRWSGHARTHANTENGCLGRGKFTWNRNGTRGLRAGRVETNGREQQKEKASTPKGEFAVGSSALFLIITATRCFMLKGASQDDPYLSPLPSQDSLGRTTEINLLINAWPRFPTTGTLLIHKQISRRRGGVLQTTLSNREIHGVSKVGSHH